MLCYRRWAAQMLTRRDMAKPVSEYHDNEPHQRHQDELNRYEMIRKPANNCRSVILNSCS